ncbi:MAG: spermine synthase [Xanthomonadales bacterium]|nr:spermine synthase [Xanthomonadales bacterium]
MIIRTPRRRRTRDGIDKFDGHPERQIIERVESEYQLIEIASHPIFGNQLIIDGDLQISESDHAYNAALVAPLLTQRQCRRVVVLGGGDGGVLAALAEAADQGLSGLERVTLVEIDPVVIDLCRAHLPGLHRNAFDHPAVDLRVGDAFAYLGSLGKSVDAVIYDLTMDPIRPNIERRAFVHEVIGLITGALRTDGVITMQCCGQSDVDPNSIADRSKLLGDLRERLDESFYSLVEQHVVIPSFGEPWTFLCGALRDGG